VQLSILVPVLNRPERVEPLVESCVAATTVEWELVFILSPHDKAEHAVVKALRHERVRWIVMREKPGCGDYARKINRGFRNTADTPWVFQAGDDIDFHPGWAELAIRTGERSGCGVIGTNDLCNPGVIRGQHSTHSLIRRSYIDECGGSDTPGTVMHTGYCHNYCDNELVEVAMSRKCFAMSAAIVEHLHPMCHKGEHDDTYRRGLEHFRRDRELLQARRPFWSPNTRRTRPIRRARLVP
jgi:glycosyltransferase involved in cell wall biosynthesis